MPKTLWRASSRLPQGRPAGPNRSYVQALLNAWNAGFHAWCSR